MEHSWDIITTVVAIIAIAKPAAFRLTAKPAAFRLTVKPAALRLTVKPADLRLTHQANCQACCLLTAKPAG